ncbi:unnamed protein product [Dracunculus medinensis]|uniref:Uncharacterized protein n=1 Tax=Dracunculus medinensis TaxID=318479 RepID=A0A0N4U8X7_DRAME|nr:unnamed protein product [Dracunculus medinensis]
MASESGASTENVFAYRKMNFCLLLIDASNYVELPGLQTPTLQPDQYNHRCKSSILDGRSYRGAENGNNFHETDHFKVRVKRPI